MSATAGTIPPQESAFSRAADVVRRNGSSFGIVGLLIAFLVLTRLINPNYGPDGIVNLSIDVLPIAFAAVGQAIVVLSGGIDLSVGSVMALASVTSAVLMKGQSDVFGVGVVVAVLLLGLLVGAINGSLVVVTKVPDIVVTLAMSFVWAGTALLVLNTPGGGASAWLSSLLSGPLVLPFLPKALVVLAVIVALVWIPLRRSALGLALYAVGSHPIAAIRSGVAVAPTKIIAYALTGFFASLGGLALTGIGGVGAPVPGSYTLQSVAAIVLGGVSLAGGTGGIFGPILAVVILQLIRTDMTFLNLNTNLATVLQGVILIGVVMFGSLVAMRRVRA